MSDVPAPNRWRALTVCMAAAVMILANVSIVNIALPSFERGLGASSTQIALIVAGYTLAFGLTLVPAGRWGDLWGRRPMFLWGLAGFGAASAAAGLAQSSWWLVVARLAQGVAAGMLNPQVLGFIEQLFPPEERPRAFAIRGVVNAVSLAAGPLVGGALLAVGGASEGWRWIFFVNLPFAAAGLVLGPRLLPARRRDTRTGVTLDLVGMGLLGVAVLSVMLPVVLATHDAQDAPWWLLAFTVPLAIGFVWWERRYARAGHDPLITGEVLRSPGFLTGSSIGSLYLAGSAAILIVLSVYLQQGLGYSALQAGFTVLPYAVGSAVNARIASGLVRRFGRRLVVAGAGLMALGLVAVDVVVRVGGSSATGWYLAAPLLVAGAGSGLVLAPNQALTLMNVPPDRASTAAAAQQTAQRITSSIGIAVTTTAFFAVQSGSGDGGSAAGAALLISVGFVVASAAVGVVELARGGGQRVPA